VNDQLTKTNAMPVNHAYDLWHAEQKTPTPEERRADRTTEAAEMSGFWRMHGARTKTDWPVAIWNGEGQDETIFQIGRKVRNTAEHRDEWDDFVASSWLHCTAVTEREYHDAMGTGFWVDLKPARQMTEEEKLGIDTSTGGNNPPIDESLADQIASLVDKAKATPEPKTQDEANAATAILDKLRALLKRAEAERVTEKEPFLQGSREVDAKWGAIANPGKEAGVDLDNRRKAYLRKEQARLDAEAAAERKRQQDLVDAENERIRKENEARLAAAQDHGNYDPTDPTDEPPELLPEVAAPVIAAPRATASSAYGRASGLKTVKVAVVDDPTKLASHFIEAKDVDFADYLQKRAAAALRGKVTLPGCSSKDELQ